MFTSTRGTPQGDNLSPVLYTVYVEATNRDLRPRSPARPPADATLPLDVEYADDTDSADCVRSYTKSRKSGVARDIHLGRSTVKQKTPRVENRWPTPPSASCGHFSSSHISLQMRLRLYTPFVVPVLTCIIGEIVVS